MSQLLFTCMIILGLGNFAAAAGGSAQNAACQKNIASLCTGESQVKGRIMHCLKANESKLSPECKAHQVKMRGARRDVREACHDDHAKFCLDNPPGTGRIIKCLREHMSELSEGCKKEIEEKKALRKGEK